MKDPMKDIVGVAETKFRSNEKTGGITHTWVISIPFQIRTNHPKVLKKKLILMFLLLLVVSAMFDNQSQYFFCNFITVIYAMVLETR